MRVWYSPIGYVHRRKTAQGKRRAGSQSPFGLRLPIHVPAVKQAALRNGYKKIWSAIAISSSNESSGRYS